MLNNLSKSDIKNHFYKLQLSLKTGSDKITPKKFESIIDNESEIIINKINNKTYKFSRYTKNIVKKNRIVYSSTIRDRIVLDILKNTLISKYKIRFQNRNEICSNIKRTLENGFKFTVIKLDIQAFYDSIPHNLLYNKLKSSSLLSDSEYLLVKKALSQSPNGVLQGLPISNCLAEIYLEGFDSEIKSIDSRLCYFARYVDDIILIFNGFLLDSEITSIKLEINAKLNKLKLTSNPIKSLSLLLHNEKSFSYLGYTFKLINPSINAKGKNISNEILIRISPDKLTNVKNKITRYFYQYNNDNNFNLLYQRLMYVTSSCYGLKFQQYIKNDVLNFYTKKISFGIYDNYSLATYESFNLINLHINDSIKYYSSSFTNCQKRTLFNCRFKDSKLHFINFHKFTNDEYINLIKSINPLYIEPLTNRRHTVIYDYFKILDI